MDYMDMYLNEEIKFRDIPLEKLNEQILREAALRDGKEYVNVIFRLYEIDNGIDLLSFASLLRNGSLEYYDMYERIFNIDPVKYFDLIPNKCKNSMMWNKLMEIDPETYLSRIPSNMLSSSMFERLLNINFDKYIELLPLKLVKPKICEIIFKHNPELLFRYSRLTYSENLYHDSLLTLEMCLKLVEVDSEHFFKYANGRYIDMVFDTDPVKYFEMIPDNRKAPHICNKMFEIDPEKYFLKIPMNYRNDDMCTKMFQRNPEKYFLEIPMQNRDLFKCERMFEIDPEKYFEHIPLVCRTLKMCNKVFDINPEKYFYLIPRVYRSALMCERMAEINVLKYFDDIPHKHRTKELWIKMFKVNPSYVMNELPKKFRNQEMFLEFYRVNPKDAFENMNDLWKTQDMCCEYFRLNYDNFECYVPKNMLTKEMYKVLLKRDFLRYSREIPDEMIDVDIIGIAKMEMYKMIENIDLVERKDLTKLMSLIIKLYPKAEDIIYISKDERIIRELYSLINNGGTIEGIAEKYMVDISYVNRILELIKSEDISSYTAIKNVLDMNQRNHFFNMINDVKILSVIIESLGKIDVKGLNIEQKLRFTYLCNKYLSYNLEDIYSFDYSKYIKEDMSMVTKFFNRVLKYNFIRNGNATIPEKKTIQFNNSWLRKYNRNKFFAIKNGVAMMEHRYGKNGDLLTLEIEEKIINVLKSEGIPLNEIIVTNAFKEYFNGNLFLYIEKLKGYDSEFEILLNNNKDKNR